MNNCLVTKLKGDVQNDNLPTVNTVFFDYVPQGTETYSQLLIYGSVEHPVTVTFKRDVYDAPNAAVVKAAANTPFTVTNIQNFYIVIASAGNERINEFVKIESPYYTPAVAASNHCLVINDKSRNNVNAFNYNENIEEFGGCFECDDDNTIVSLVPAGTKYLSFSGSNNNTIPLSSIIGKCTLLEYVISYQRGPIETYYAIAYLNDGTRVNNTLRLCDVRFRGSVVNLPSGILWIGENGSGLTGDLMDYVTRCRNIGRTSGTIRIVRGSAVVRTAWPNLTYNGNSLAYCVDNNIIPANAVYMNWTATGDPTFTTTPVNGQASDYEISNFTLNQYAQTIGQ